MAPAMPGPAVPMPSAGTPSLLFSSIMSVQSGGSSWRGCGAWRAALTLRSVGLSIGRGHSEPRSATSCSGTKSATALLKHLAKRPSALFTSTAQSDLSHRVAVTGSHGSAALFCQSRMVGD